MKLSGFNIKDISFLNKVRIINNKHFDHGYDSMSNRNKARDYNLVVYYKLKALMKFIQDDLRFSNFEIGIGHPTSQDRGKYRNYLWIWMADKKLIRKYKNDKKISPKLRIPQIQVSVHNNGFTTAEMWFDKQAFSYRNKLIEFLKNKYKDDKKLWFFTWHENEKESKFDKPGTKRNIGPFIKNLSEEYYNEAGVSIGYDESFLKKSPTDLVNAVIEDLLYLINRYYEPIYGKVIYENPVKTKGKGGHKRTPVDPERRKEIETKAYDVVEAYFQGIKYEVTSVASDNVGWDLEATGRNEKLLLEVKGLSGDFVNIELTPNEYTNLRRHKNNYRVCVVTKTLDSPQLYIYAHQHNVGWTDQYGNLLTEVERTGLKMYWE